MQQIYRRTSVSKYHFNNVAKQLYWNHTSAQMFCKFDAYFRTSFPRNTSGRLLLNLYRKIRNKIKEQRESHYVSFHISSYIGKARCLPRVDSLLSSTIYLDPRFFSNHVQSKSMGWFLHDRGLRHERAIQIFSKNISSCFGAYWRLNAK